MDQNPVAAMNYNTYYVNLIFLLVDGVIVWGDMHTEDRIKHYSRKREALGEGLYAAFERQEHPKMYSPFYTQVLYRGYRPSQRVVSKMFGSFLKL